MFFSPTPFCVPGISFPFCTQGTPVVLVKCNDFIISHWDFKLVLVFFSFTVQDVATRLIQKTRMKALPSHASDATLIMSRSRAITLFAMKGKLRNTNSIQLKLLEHFSRINVPKTYISVDQNITLYRTENLI